MWGCGVGQERKMLGYVGETHESFMIAGMCQYDPIQVTVGDVLVFKKAVAGDDVFALASQWHYAECDFSDGGAPLAADATSSGNEVRYTIRAQDKNKRLYLASSRAGACKGGQRVLVSVDDFKQGTLAEALHLIDLKTYETDEGARHLIERIWCFEDHCPTPAMGWYEGNAEWAKARCVADAYSLLGFVYRKKPSPELQRAEKYYKKALELVPQHCEATSYMGEFYLQTSDLPKASDTYLRLEALADTQKSEACKVSLRALQAAWNKKGWCPPADANSKAAATPCAGQASAAAHLSSQASGLVLSALLLLLAAARA
jgi:tetratricopeptide (TPR) repeat protein